MNKKEESLIKGKIYIIEGIEMSYLYSDGSKHYFSKTEENGVPKGRKRILRGDEVLILRMLSKRYAK